MKLTEEKQRNTLGLVNIQWAQENLLLALRCKDSDSDSIYTA